jgi:HAE1 family hydrophobic/amphiphilic exporter-1
VKPQVNLFGAYTATGVAGSLRTTENPFSTSNALLFERVNELSRGSGLSPLPDFSFGSLPGNLVGGYVSSLGNLPRYGSIQAGLQMDFTIRNHAARAGLAQSVIAERRLKVEVLRTEQRIEAEVRNALQAIQTARQRIAAAEASARAAREKLESETRLFQSGESTNFLVLTRQNEYLDSRHRAVVAQLDLNKAVAQLDQAAGNTLKRHGVTLQ